MQSFVIRTSILLLFSLFFIVLLYIVLSDRKTGNLPVTESNSNSAALENPLSVIAMRSRSYPGSELVIEEELPEGANYKQYVASYFSDDLKIYGLLTIPTSKKPEKGYPAIIFNHGYIPPAEYKTTERYVSYQDSLARNGYITFKSDYRGHGNSEGNPEGAYFSPAYTVDVLNALSSVKKLSQVDTNNIGMWGHSLGGNITQRALVVKPQDIQAAVIWGGVVGSYEDIFSEWWNKRQVPTTTPRNPEQQSYRPTRQNFINMYGQPSAGNPFWADISPTTYISDVSSPVQLHHGLADETVPYALSQKYYDALKDKGKTAEVFYYENTDHNISQSFNLAMERSVDFFDKYLK
ncbi:MAG TPA: alpha/beta fold hydrolase [Candidatus Levybacteria bacterium]|nr:alpha/beta fold hydrolase [Candidatus Levybacteria bacterium]